MKNTKKAAQGLASYYGTRDPFRLARDLGYIVLFVPLVNLRGFCCRLRRCSIIYIDTELGEFEKCFVCAHEIWHLREHKGYNRIFMDTNTHMVTSRYENEADQFAVDFLLEDEDLEEMCNVPVSNIADFFGIEYDLADYRMSTVKPPAWMLDEEYC